MAVCNVCYRHCDIREGGLGFCGARTCRDKTVTADNYGRITSLALDPVEKKPLYHFYPGSLILSAGSYGCNLRCPFCQNHEISWSAQAMRFKDRAQYVSPLQLADTAEYYKPRGNIGIAFTYNEPLIGYEYIRDTAKLIHERGMKTVLVTNGMADLSVLEELSPYTDAMNIDLKGFTDHYYEDVLKGSRRMVMDFIEAAVKVCHVEITTLIVPGENDTREEMEQLSAWIASLENGADIPLHISRFFPRFHMTDRNPTSVKLVYELTETAKKHLKYVYPGNC